MSTSRRFVVFIIFIIHLIINVALVSTSLECNADSVANGGFEKPVVEVQEKILSKDELAKAGWGSTAGATILSGTAASASGGAQAVRLTNGQMIYQDFNTTLISNIEWLFQYRLAHEGQTASLDVMAGPPGLTAAVETITLDQTEWRPSQNRYTIPSNQKITRFAVSARDADIVLDDFAIGLLSHRLLLSTNTTNVEIGGRVAIDVRFDNNAFAAEIKEMHVLLPDGIECETDAISVATKFGNPEVWCQNSDVTIQGPVAIPCGNSFEAHLDVKVTKGLKNADVTASIEFSDVMGMAGLASDPLRLASRKAASYTTTTLTITSTTTSTTTPSGFLTSTIKAKHDHSSSPESTPATELADDDNGDVERSNKVVIASSAGGAAVFFAAVAGYVCYSRRRDDRAASLSTQNTEYSYLQSASVFTRA